MRKWREASVIPARLIAGSATVQRGPWRMQAERRQEKDFSRHAPAIRLDFLTFACTGFHVLCPGGYSMVSHCQHQCDIRSPLACLVLNLFLCSSVGHVVQ